MRPSDVNVSLFTAISTVSHRNIRFSSRFECLNVRTLEKEMRRIQTERSTELLHIRCSFHVEICVSDGMMEVD